MKWTVSVDEIYNRVIQVEAESEAEAIDTARQAFDLGPSNPDDILFVTYGSFTAWEESSGDQR